MPNDWMPGVRQQPTNATGTRTLGKVEAVVCHVIQGHRATMDVWAAEKRPVEHEASYHFVIDEDGTPTQYVPISMRSWHAGRVPDPSLVTWSRYRPSTNPNDYTVGIGAAGFSETSWNDAQHASCVTILRWLKEEWCMTIDDTTVIGHRDLDPESREHDPGPNWDLEWLLAHVVPPGEENDPNKPPPLGPFDSQRWAEAWSRGATPIRTDGGDHIYEIKIRSTE